MLATIDREIFVKKILSTLFTNKIKHTKYFPLASLVSVK